MLGSPSLRWPAGADPVASVPLAVPAVNMSHGPGNRAVAAGVRGSVTAIRRAAILVPVLALAACSFEETDPTPVSRPTASGELLVRVETVGGLLPPLEAQRAVPAISIYGDGLVLVPAPVPDIFPGPAGHALDAFHLDAEMLDEIVTAAHVAGLHGPERRVEQEGPGFVADGGATVITVVSNGQRHVTTADGLFDVEPGTPLRRALADFVVRLVELRNAATDVVSYEPTAVAVFVAAFDEAFVSEPQLVTRVEWPFGDALATWGEPVPPDGLSVDVRCRVIEGDQLDELRAFSTLTVAVQDGEERILAWRPLLPDEATC